MTDKSKSKKSAEFKHFDDLLKKVIKVPKEEIDRREKERKERKDPKKKA